MNILYIGYWGLNEGLSIATIKPHLEILSGFSKVDKIFFSTIERDEKDVEFNWGLKKVVHIPYYSAHKLSSKFSDFISIPSNLKSVCIKENIKYIICRSSLAGIIGYLLFKKLGISFSVESFEPHAEYMREAGIWKRWDIRYWIVKYYENQQLKKADYIFTVSYSYREYLISEQKRIKNIEVIPCSVDIKKFLFSEDSRKDKRCQLSINENQPVLIYVGKFGGIYYDQEAFSFFRQLKTQIPELFIIILTPQNKEPIALQLNSIGFSNEDFFIDMVEHSEIPPFLSASDIAICLQRSSKWSMAFSPIKNGEYWANGLPILISQNIGDDSYLIKNSDNGIIFDIDNLQRSGFNDLNQINRLLKDSNRNSIVVLAEKYRSVSIAKHNYKEMLNEIL